MATLGHVAISLIGFAAFVILGGRLMLWLLVRSDRKRGERVIDEIVRQRQRRREEEARRRWRADRGA